MLCNSIENITEPKPATKYFPEPSNSTLRRYEALRAYFAERHGSWEAARRFGPSAGCFRLLIHAFCQDSDHQFFISPAKGRRKMPKRDAVQDWMFAMRKENLPIFFEFTRVLFRGLVDAAAWIILKKKDIIFRFQKKTHNPLLIAAGLDKISTLIPCV